MLIEYRAAVFAKRCVVGVSLLLLFTALLLLGVATAFVSVLGSLDCSTTLVVVRDEASEVLELFPLVFHGAATERKRTNELGKSQRALHKAFLSELGQHILASLFD